MASIVYNGYKRDIHGGSFSLSANTLKVALVTSTYTPNAITHENFSDITNEVTGVGYTAGGETLTGVNIYLDGANSRSVFDATDVTWTGSTITARGAVIYKSTGTASTSKLIAYIDFGTDKTSSSADFSIQWNSSGIFYTT
jgi:hypothetical protein